MVWNTKMWISHCSPTNKCPVGFVDIVVANHHSMGEQNGESYYLLTVLSTIGNILTLRTTFMIMILLIEEHTGNGSISQETNMENNSIATVLQTMNLLLYLGVITNSIFQPKNPKINALDISHFMLVMILSWTWRSSVIVDICFDFKAHITLLLMKNQLFSTQGHQYPSLVIKRISFHLLLILETLL